MQFHLFLHSSSKVLDPLDALLSGMAQTTAMEPCELKDCPYQTIKRINHELNLSPREKQVSVGTNRNAFWLAPKDATHSELESSTHQLQSKIY